MAYGVLNSAREIEADVRENYAYREHGGIDSVLPVPLAEEGKSVTCLEFALIGAARMEPAGKPPQLMMFSIEGAHAAHAEYVFSHEGRWYSVGYMGKLEGYETLEDLAIACRECFLRLHQAEYEGPMRYCIASLERQEIACFDWRHGTSPMDGFNAAVDSVSELKGTVTAVLAMNGKKIMQRTRF